MNELQTTNPVTSQQTQALDLRLQGNTYLQISEELDIPVNTLKKWFAPSVNRHNLATLKEEQLQEFSDTSKKLLQANVVAITEKLIEMASEGNIRAMIEVLDRVHGTPIKQELPVVETKQYPQVLVRFLGRDGKPHDSFEEVNESKSE